MPLYDTDATQALATQFMELWQHQIAHTMKDPEISGKMMENFRLMQQSYLTMMQAYAPTHLHPQPSGHGAPVSDDGRTAILKLERRLGECEARIAALEAELAGKRENAA